MPLLCAYSWPHPTQIQEKKCVLAFAKRTFSDAENPGTILYLVSWQLYHKRLLHSDVLWASLLKKSGQKEGRVVDVFGYNF